MYVVDEDLRRGRVARALDHLRFEPRVFDHVQLAVLHTLGIEQPLYTPAVSAPGLGVNRDFRHARYRVLTERSVTAEWMPPFPIAEQRAILPADPGLLQRLPLVEWPTLNHPLTAASGTGP